MITNAVAEHPASWSWGYSLADQLIIDKMDEHTRAVVERHIRKQVLDLKIETDEEDEYYGESAYADGFRAGVEAAAANASSTTVSRRAFKGKKR